MTFFSFVGIATVGALIDEFVRWATADHDGKKDKKIVSHVAKQQDTKF